jgi:hypothetical protein
MKLTARGASDEARQLIPVFAGHQREGPDHGGRGMVTQLTPLEPHHPRGNDSPRESGGCLLTLVKQLTVPRQAHPRGNHPRVAPRPSGVTYLRNVPAHARPTGQGSVAGQGPAAGEQSVEADEALLGWSLAA